ncbi:MAG: nucleotidyltransferase domain-containing protein [bacterium]
MQKVRLNEKYISTIKMLAEKYFDTNEVRIFGSRADLFKKGGDIDIFIHTNKSENILKSKIAFLRDFEILLGEQKVDLVIQSGNSIKKIYQIAEKEGILI